MEDPDGSFTTFGRVYVATRWTSRRSGSLALVSVAACLGLAVVCAAAPAQRARCEGFCGGELVSCRELSAIADRIIVATNLEDARLRDVLIEGVPEEVRLIGRVTELESLECNGGAWHLAWSGFLSSDVRDPPARRELVRSDEVALIAGWLSPVGSDDFEVVVEVSGVMRQRRLALWPVFYGTLRE